MECYQKSKVLPSYFLVFSTLLLATISYIFYWPSLNYGFKFDDAPNILKFYGIRNKSFQELFFSSTRWISSWLNTLYYAFNKFDPFIYRLANVSFHTLSGLLVFYIIYQCTSRYSHKSFNRCSEKNFIKNYSFLIAFTTAILFLLHPVQTQTVSYVIQGQLEGLATFFTLSIIATFIAAATTSSKVIKYSLYTASLILAFFSTGTKEIAIVAPLLTILVDWFFIAQGTIKEIRKRTVYYLFLFGIAGICYIYLLKPHFIKHLLTLNRHVENKMGNVLTAAPQDKITVFSYFISQFKVILHYIGIFIWPFNISADYDWKICSGILAYDCFIPLLILASLAFFILYRLYNNKTDILSFCFMWFIIVVTPRSSIVPDTELLADYKTYLASPSILFLISLGLIKALTILMNLTSSQATLSTKRNPEQSYTQYSLLYCSIVLLIMLPMGYLTYSRNHVWKDEQSFWGNVLERAPKKARAYNNYGIVLYEQKRYKKALDYFDKAIELDSSYPDPWINKSCAYNQLHDLDNALQAALKSVEVNPILETYHNLGYVYMCREEYTKAKKYLKHVVKNQPTHGKALFNLGCVYNELGNKQKTWQCFKKCCTQADFDTNAASFNMYGLTSMLLEKYDDAIFAYKKSLELDPTSIKTKFNLAEVYSLINEHNKASLLYKELINKKPNDALLLYKYAQQLYKLNKIKEALLVYQQLKEDDPTNFFVDAHIKTCQELLNKS